MNGAGDDSTGGESDRGTNGAAADDGRYPPREARPAAAETFSNNP